MKHFKKLLRLLSLLLFMMLAVAGIGIGGIAPTLTKDRKLFPDIELVIESHEKNAADNPATEKFKL